MSRCPDGRCDGSGFLYDEQARRAFPCSCRPGRLARRRAAAVAGRIPKRFREVSFERELVFSIERTNPQVVRVVRRYVGTIADQLAGGRGLWFAGDVGTGKTTLAMLVSKSAMQADHTVAIYSVPRLLALLRETYDEGSRYSLTGLIDRLCSVELLHLDDLGAEQTSPWVLEQLYTIVNTRYEDGRAIVVTSNLSRPRDRDDLPQGQPTERFGIDRLQDQVGRRTVSRLQEICETLPMCGEDRRGDAQIRYPESPRPPERSDWPVTGETGDEPLAYGELPRTGW